MADEFDHKFELLKLEIQILQDVIRNYETILFTIKGWAITLFSAVIFFTVQSTKPLYLVFCAFSVLLFWVVDAVFKVTQRKLIERYNVIQGFLQSSQFSQAVKEQSLRILYFLIYFTVWVDERGIVYFSSFEQCCMLALRLFM